MPGNIKNVMAAIDYIESHLHEKLDLETVAGAVHYSKSNQQLRKMLYREGMSISVKSAILAAFFCVTVGALLCYLANKGLALKFILFEFNILSDCLQ